MFLGSMVGLVAVFRIRNQGMSVSLSKQGQVTVQEVKFPPKLAKLGALVELVHTPFFVNLFSKKNSVQRINQFKHHSITIKQTPTLLHHVFPQNQVATNRSSLLEVHLVGCAEPRRELQALRQENLAHRVRLCRSELRCVSWPFAVVGWFGALRVLWVLFGVWGTDSRNNGG